MRIQDLPCVTVAQMREIDRLMIEEVGITLAQMMESAGRALGAMGRNAVRDVVRARVVAMAGPGGNGGGVLVAARRLAIWGADVSVVLAATPERIHDAAAHELATMIRMGITIAGPEAPLPALAGVDLLLDGVFGYGLDGAPRGRAADLIRAMNASGVPILALDVPSGLSADTGEAFEPTIRARQTLTLALPKIGLVQPRARPYVGELYLADISVPSLVYRRIGLEVGPLFAQSEVVPVSLGAATAF